MCPSNSVRASSPSKASKPVWDKVTRVPFLLGFNLNETSVETGHGSLPFSCSVQVKASSLLGSILTTPPEEGVFAVFWDIHFHTELAALDKFKN